MSKKKQKILERRKHQRYSAKTGSCAINNKVGQIIDISMGGLSFSYIDRGDWSNEGVELGMLFGEGELCLDDLPLKIISDCAIGSGLSIIRRCGVEFGKLDARQISQLEYFIWANTKERQDPEFSA